MYLFSPSPFTVTWEVLNSDRDRNPNLELTLVLHCFIPHSEVIKPLALLYLGLFHYPKK